MIKNELIHLEAVTLRLRTKVLLFLRYYETLVTLGEIEESNTLNKFIEGAEGFTLSLEPLDIDNSANLYSDPSEQTICLNFLEEGDGIDSASLNCIASVNISERLIEAGQSLSTLRGYIRVNNFNLIVNQKHIFNYVSLPEVLNLTELKEDLKNLTTRGNHRVGFYMP